MTARMVRAHWNTASAFEPGYNGVPTRKGGSNVGAARMDEERAQ